MPLLAEFIGAIVRWLLTIAGASLIAHHILTADQADRFSQAIVEHVMMAIPVLIPIAWSLWKTYKGRLKFLAALSLPAGSTEAAVEDKLKTTSVLDSVAKSIPIVLLAALLGAGALTLPACASSNPPPTKVAAVADAATKIQQSANAILQATQTANATVLPSTGQPLVSRAQLDDVALVVNQIGRSGLVLKTALDDYNAAKAAGANAAAQRAVVQQTLDDINRALAMVGKAIPNGTLQAVDQAIAAILTAIAQVKASAL